jgi:aryl carrier-like protein
MDATRARIDKLQADRDRRRSLAVQTKQERLAQEQALREAGETGSVELIRLVEEWRSKHANEQQPHSLSTSHNINICVRKRPMSEKERQQQDHDAITVLHPKVWIHT